MRETWLSLVVVEGRDAPARKRRKITPFLTDQKHGGEVDG